MDPVDPDPEHWFVHALVSLCAVGHQLFSTLLSGVEDPEPHDFRKLDPDPQ